MVRDPIDPDDNELATRMNESREDTFEVMQDPSRDFGDIGLTFQEFNRRVDEKREGVMRKATTEESASIAVLNDFADGRAEDPAYTRDEQRTVATTSRDLYSARKAQEQRSQEAVNRDNSTNAERVTGDFEEWRKRPGELDFPGIDTRGNIGPQLAGKSTDEKRQEAKLDALYMNEPMTEQEEVGAQIRSEDVSLGPEEALGDIGGSAEPFDTPDPFGEVDDPFEDIDGVF